MPAPRNDVEVATASDIAVSEPVEPTPATPLSEADAFERFNALFDQWLCWPPEVLSPMGLPAGMIQVEEIRQNGTRVIRTELPGIDPAKDVELFVSNGMLWIDAQRREEQTKMTPAICATRSTTGP
jgi:HSP20 family molecular chaperone IbpA